MHLMGEDLLYFSFCTERGSFQNCLVVGFFFFPGYMFQQKMVHLFLTVLKGTKLDILLWSDLSELVYTAGYLPYFLVSFFLA